MSLSDWRRRIAAFAAVVALPAVLAGCTWQPLYGTQSIATDSAAAGYALQHVYVREVDSRVAQQVRNQLIFLLQGGKDNPEAPYEVRLRVVATPASYAAVKDNRDFTVGSVAVTVSYDLFEKATMKRLADGTRTATASFDRTNQNFANSRALRDAETRAAREVAEQLRLALAADLAG